MVIEKYDINDRGDSIDFTKEKENEIKMTIIAEEGETSAVFNNATFGIIITKLYQFATDEHWDVSNMEQFSDAMTDAFGMTFEIMPYCPETPAPEPVVMLRIEYLGDILVRVSTILQIARDLIKFIPLPLSEELKFLENFFIQLMK